jgi:PAS domain S-box-containing protein
MRDDNENREQLLVELGNLRRRLAELESENSLLRKLRPAEIDRIDVTEDRNADENARFAQFTIDNCADAVFWVKSDGSPIYVNDAACRSLGYSREELLNLSVQDINTSFPTKQWEVHWRETKQNRGCTFQAQHKRKDGSVFPVELRINFIEFEGQEYHCTFAIDISERKQAEQALQESMEKFRSIVENAYAGIFTVDEAYRLVYVNDQFSALTGYPKDYLLGSDFRHLLTAESRHLTVERYIRRQRGENVPNRYELDVLRLDREVRRMEMTVALVKDATGTPRIMGQLIDITERKQTEEAVRKSERRLSEALQVARMGCWEYDVNQDVFILNDQYYSLHGTTASREGGYRISSEEFLHKYVHPEDAVLLRSAIQRATEATDPDYQFQTEERILTADAEVRWVNLWFRIEHDARGQTIKMFGVIQDITERKHADEALRLNEQKYRELVENANSIILRWNTKGEITFLNEFGQKFFGYSEEEILGRPAIETIVPKIETGGRDLRPLMHEICTNPHAFEKNINENVLKDGKRVWIDWTNKAVFDRHSRLVEIFSIGSDITERKRTEAAIRNIVAGVSSEIGSKFFDSITSHFASTLLADCTFIAERIDRDGTEFMRTLSFCLDGQITENIEYPLKGSPCEIVLKEGRCSYLQDVQKVFPLDKELAKLGAEACVAVELSDSSGMPRGVLAALYRSPIRDVEFAESILQIFAARAGAEIDRKRVEDERLRLVKAIEQAGESILIADASGKILYANPAFAEITGYSVREVLGQTPAILKSGTHDRNFYESIWSTIKGGNVWRGHFVNRKKNGTLYNETATISPIRDEAGNVLNYVMVGRDITSEVTLQKQLLQAQKMEAIGTLAGGIAHDFNNLLQAILGYADLLLMRKAQDDPDRHRIEIIHRAARDGADLVSRILTFSRKGEAKTRPIDLNREIRRAEKLLQRTVSKMIEIKLELADDLSIIDADAPQLEQILLNLAVNAQHAMPEGGRLLITTRNVSLNGEYLQTYPHVKSGKYVLLTVSDTGIGMTLDVQDRIFDPFFTTKANGEGTGLGLAMVHGIVSQHRGYITCYSQPDHGTSFRIYFPVSPTEYILAPPEIREMPAFGNETILLVDDDDRVRDMAREMIRDCGYHVLPARDGEEALEVYRDHRDTIALTILDLIMPGMGGKKCLEELLRIDPQIKVLIASGYSSRSIALDHQLVAARGFIRKPYDAKGILGAIRDALDR